MNEELGEVTKLVAQLLEVQAEIEQSEEFLKTRKEQARKLSQEAIPLAMEELGYREVELTDGTKITLKKEIYCSFGEAKRPEGLKWLEDNNCAGIIKNEISASFAKGEDSKAAQLALFMRNAGLDYEQNRTVHPQTLKAFIKERLEKGQEIPLEKFGAIEVTQSKITLPSKERFSL